MRDGILLRTFEVFLNFKIGARAGYKANRDERIITTEANVTVLCSLHKALMSWKLGLWTTPANLRQVYAYGTIGDHIRQIHRYRSNGVLLFSARFHEAVQVQEKGSPAHPDTPIFPFLAIS